MRGLEAPSAATSLRAGFQRRGSDRTVSRSSTGKAAQSAERSMASTAMRHACASLLIAQGWLPKRIQDFMGHASIGLTYDTYGHLFKDAEGDQRAMAKLEGELLS